jgi:hypothetical protein
MLPLLRRGGKFPYEFVIALEGWQSNLGSGYEEDLIFFIK